MRKALLLLEFPGRRLGFTVDGEAEQAIFEDGTVQDFLPSAELDQLPPRQAPLIGDATSDGSVQVGLAGDVVQELWDARPVSPVQLAKATVYWWPEGELLRPEHEVFSGCVRGEPAWELGDQPRLSCTLSPARRTDDAPFPPAGIGDEDRFPTAPDDALTHAVPVVYGLVRGMPLYAVSQPAGLGTVRLVLAGHRVASTQVQVMRDGVAIGALATVAYDFDGRGGAYAYVTVTDAQYAAGSSFYALELQGHAGTNGSSVDRLGDVLEHAFRTYAGASWFELDRPRVEAARPRLNRVAVGLYANERQDGTLMELFTSRIAGQFPVAFGFSAGRFGWDATLFPEAAELTPSDRIVYRQGTHERTGPKETSADDVVARIELAYATDGFAGGSVRALHSDEGNSQEARRALTRWGPSPLVTHDAPDCPDSQSAYVLLVDLARKRGRVRLRVEYAGLNERFWRLPLLAVVAVTDEDLGWVDEPCLLEAIYPNLDGTCGVVLLTVGGL